MILGLLLLVLVAGVVAVVAQSRRPTASVPVAPVVGARRRIPAVAEALGYLGGVLATTGVVLIVSRTWPDLSTAARLALAGIAAVALAGGGLLVREHVDPALTRLRWTLWTASTAAAGLFAGLLAADRLDLSALATAAAAAGAVALWSTLLRWWRERPLQQVTFLGGSLTLVGTLVALVAPTGVAGLAVWATAAALLALGLVDRTPLPWLTVAAGAVGGVVGSTLVAVDWTGPGLLFALATAVGLVALATVPGPVRVRSHQLIVGGVGGMALWQVVPGTLGYFAEGAGIATGVATWAVGLVVVALGIRHVVRLPLAAQVVGGLAIVGGAALTAVQSVGFATLFGLGTALALVALGMLPGRALLSIMGSVGLLVNVPWAIGHFFPGEGRAPLLLLAAGAVVLVVAVLLTHMGDRFRHDLGGPRRPMGPMGSGPTAPTPV